jgi:hypothetical protein
VDFAPGYGTSGGIRDFQLNRYKFDEGWSGREDLNAPEAHKPP